MSLNYVSTKWGTVHRVTVSANGERLAALMQDGTIRIHSVSSGEMDVLATIEAYRDTNQPVRAMGMLPTGDRLAVGLSDGVVETWGIGEPTRRQHRIVTSMPTWQDNLALARRAGDVPSLAGQLHRALGLDGRDRPRAGAATR